MDVRRLERRTSSMSTMRSNQLSYTSLRWFLNIPQQPSAVQYWICDGNWRDESRYNEVAVRVRCLEFMYWQEVSGNWFLVPERPRAIIHFLGGAFVAAAPHLTYRWLLEALYQEGYAVISTPFINTFDHGAIAAETLITFEQGLTFLGKRRPELRSLPVYGLGHSMGCKVHLLMGSQSSVERAGNIFISFNNFPARKSIPFLEQFSQLVSDFQLDTRLEFTPNPEETLTLIQSKYATPYNLLIKFRSDNIDQTRPLSDVLIGRFPRTTTVRILQGSHTTPIAQDIQWEANGSFSPFDAIGQFAKQAFYRDIKALKAEVLYWLTGD